MHKRGCSCSNSGVLSIQPLHNRMNDGLKVALRNEIAPGHTGLKALVHKRAWITHVVVKENECTNV